MIQISDLISLISHKAKLLPRILFLYLFCMKISTYAAVVANIDVIRVQSMTKNLHVSVALCCCNRESFKKDFDLKLIFTFFFKNCNLQLKIFAQYFTLTNVELLATLSA